MIGTMPPIVLLDANVLFPFFLRDTLLCAAEQGCYRIHWSDKILDEMARNLVEQERVTKDAAKRLQELMEQAFPDAKVEGWEHREADMKNQVKDRHVAAAADHIGASIIVTSNLKDFKNLPAGLSAMAPDVFLVELVRSMPDQVIEALKVQTSAYRKPPSTVEDLLAVLAKTLPKFAAAADGAIKKGANDRSK